MNVNKGFIDLWGSRVHRLFVPFRFQLSDVFLTPSILRHLPRRPATPAPQVDVLAAKIDTAMLAAGDRLPAVGGPLPREVDGGRRRRVPVSTSNPRAHERDRDRACCRNLPLTNDDWCSILPRAGMKHTLPSLPIRASVIYPTSPLGSSVQLPILCFVFLLGSSVQLPICFVF